MNRAGICLSTQGSPRCPDRGWHASPLVSVSMRRARRVKGLQIVNRELPFGDRPLYPSARGGVVEVFAGDGTEFLCVCSDLPDREGPSTPQAPAAHGASPPGDDGPAAFPASTSAMAPTPKTVFRRRGLAPGFGFHQPAPWPLSSFQPFRCRARP